MAAELTGWPDFRHVTALQSKELEAYREKSPYCISQAIWGHDYDKGLGFPRANLFHTSAALAPGRQGHLKGQPLVDSGWKCVLSPEDARTAAEKAYLMSQLGS